MNYEDLAMRDSRLKLLLISVSGILTGLAVTFPEYFGFLEWVSLTPTVYLLFRFGEKCSLKSYFLTGLLYFFVFGIVCYHWFTDLYPLEFTGIGRGASVVVIALAILGLSLIQAAIGGLAFLLFGVLEGLGAFSKMPILKIFALPALFALFEYSQTLFWFGFPFARLCLGQSYFLPFISGASLLGSYAISALIVFVNCTAAYAFIHRKSKPISRLAMSLGIGAFALNIAVGGAVQLITGSITKDNETVKVALIQGNFSSVDGQITKPYEALDAYMALTEQAALEGTELIVWPETALPFSLDTASAIGAGLEDLAYRTGADIIIGCLSDCEGGAYNVTYRISPENGFDEGYYAKIKPVPFGEYVPMRSFFSIVFPALTEINLFSYDIVAGDKAQVYDIDGVGKIGSIICYDSVYGDIARKSVANGAELIALSTNDSWFGQSAALSMHLCHARLRSVELGRSTVRAANTGITAIISPEGQVLQEIGIGEQGYLVCEAALCSHRTLYSKIGNLFIYICAAEVAGLLALGIYRRRKNNNSK